jgi:hypothetical protein
MCAACVRSDFVVPLRLLLLLHGLRSGGRLCAASCTDDDPGLQALGLPMTCATIASYSQGLAVAGHQEGLCSVLMSVGLLPLCCASCTAVDECSSVPCANGGTCTDLTAAYSCVCAYGWGGVACEDVWVPPDVCPNATYIRAANASIVCTAPDCVFINGGAETCTRCSVCGVGFTRAAECVREGATGNGTDGADTVCTRALIRHGPCCGDAAAAAALLLPTNSNSNDRPFLRACSNAVCTFSRPLAPPAHGIGLCGGGAVQLSEAVQHVLPERLVIWSGAHPHGLRVCHRWQLVSGRADGVQWCAGHQPPCC